MRDPLIPRSHPAYPSASHPFLGQIAAGMLDKISRQDIPPIYTMFNEGMEAPAGVEKRFSPFLRFDGGQTVECFIMFYNCCLKK